MMSLPTPRMGWSGSAISDQTPVATAQRAPRED